jgi:hypothetical protein
MVTLKKALAEGKLNEFIAEREGQAGDAAAVEKTLGSMAGANPGKPVRKPGKA